MRQSIRLPGPWLRCPLLTRRRGSGQRACRRLRAPRAEHNRAGPVASRAPPRVRRRLLHVLEPGHHDHGAGLSGRVHATAIIPESKITPVFTLPAGLAQTGPSGDIGLDAPWFRRATPATRSMIALDRPRRVRALRPCDQAERIWAGQLYARTCRSSLSNRSDRRLQGQRLALDRCGRAPAQYLKVRTSRPSGRRSPTRLPTRRAPAARRRQLTASAILSARP